MNKIILTLALALSLGMIATVAVADQKQIELAEFKNSCFKMNGKLEYTNKRWTCLAKNKSDSGLTSLPVYFPEK
jgi:hypothetical protein